MKQNFKSYFQTTEMGESLKIQCEENAVTQEDGVAQIFSDTRRALSPSDILDLFPSRVPITSIRRAITQLTKKGVLIQTDATKMSEWNRPEHLWIHSSYEHLIY